MYRKAKSGARAIDSLCSILFTLITLPGTSFSYLENISGVICDTTSRYATSYATICSGFHRPEVHSRTRPSRLSELFETQENLAYNHDEKWLTFTPCFYDRTYQAPYAFLHTCCETAPASCQTIAIERYTGTIQTMLHPCTYFQGNSLYVHGMYVYKPFWATQSRYQNSSLTIGLLSPPQAKSLFQTPSFRQLHHSMHTKSASAIPPPAEAADLGIMQTSFHSQ